MIQRWKFWTIVLFIKIFGCDIVHKSTASPNDGNDITDVLVPNIHAVIVSSSRYWFNYRHAVNALGIYRILKKNGVPDSQIVLMLADEYAANSRNPYKNGMYAQGVHGDTWYTEDTEIDYRGSDVTVQNFINAVLGTAPKSLDKTNHESKMLIYLTGHGGDQFFKFQDEEEITAHDIANLAQTLHERNRVSSSLWIADTCQAFTLFDKVNTSNVLAFGSSLRGENAYAHHSDRDLGLSVIERWTNGFVLQYEKFASSNRHATLKQIMVSPFDGNAPLGAHVGIKEGINNTQTFANTLMSEFFGPVQDDSKKNNKRNQKQQQPPPQKTSEAVPKTTTEQIFPQFWNFYISSPISLLEDYSKHHHDSYCDNENSTSHQRQYEMHKKSTWRIVPTNWNVFLSISLFFVTVNGLSWIEKKLM